MLSRGSKKQLVVAIATRHPGALAALESAPVERREAVTTGGLYRALPGVHLVVADLDALAESLDCTRQRLAQILSNSNVPVVDGATFASDPSGWLSRAGAASGIIEVLTPASVVLTSLSGGVGKTTLSLSLARYFRRQTGLSVAVVEISSGPSALLALLSTDSSAHLYEVVTQFKPWPRWDGITLAPMDWRTARLMRMVDVQHAWKSLVDSHILTIFDAPAYHPFWETAKQMGRILIVSDSRPDSIANAIYLRSEESTEGIVLNRASLRARLALETPLAVLPDVGSDAQSFPAVLARKLMQVLYPGWRS